MSESRKVEQAIRFLGASDAPLSDKIRFLEEKGLSPDEISGAVSKVDPGAVPSSSSSGHRAALPYSPAERSYLDNGVATSGVGMMGGLLKWLVDFGLPGAVAAGTGLLIYTLTSDMEVPLPEENDELQHQQQQQQQGGLYGRGLYGGGGYGYGQGGGYGSYGGGYGSGQTGFIDHSFTPSGSLRANTGDMPKRDTIETGMGDASSSNFSGGNSRGIEGATRTPFSPPKSASAPLSFSSNSSAFGSSSVSAPSNDIGDRDLDLSSSARSTAQTLEMQTTLLTAAIAAAKELLGNCNGKAVTDGIDTLVNKVNALEGRLSGVEKRLRSSGGGGSPSEEESQKPDEPATPPRTTLQMRLERLLCAVRIMCGYFPRVDDPSRIASPVGSTSVDGETDGETVPTTTALSHGADSNGLTVKAKIGTDTCETASVLPGDGKTATARLSLDTTATATATAPATHDDVGLGGTPPSTATKEAKEAKEAKESKVASLLDPDKKDKPEETSAEAEEQTGAPDPTDPIDERTRLGASTLLLYVSKLVDHPSVPRYRRVSTGNRMFQDTVSSLAGHEDVLTAVGFKKQGGKHSSAVFEWQWAQPVGSLDLGNNEEQKGPALAPAFTVVPSANATTSLSGASTSEDKPTEEESHIILRECLHLLALVKTGESPRKLSEETTVDVLRMSPEEGQSLDDEKTQDLTQTPQEEMQEASVLESADQVLNSVTHDDVLMN
jgi:hypothetical protein